MDIRESDPYETLGVKQDADETELRQAYRQLAQLHHPDHNDGSPAAARRFEEIHAAYLEILRRRAATFSSRDGAREAELSARLAELEGELRAARRARTRPRRRAPAGRGTGQQAADVAHPSVARLAQLIEGLDALASQLDGLD